MCRVQVRVVGFTTLEVLVVVVLVVASYLFVADVLQARRESAVLVSSLTQGRLWSGMAEIERQRGALPRGTVAADALQTRLAPSPYTPLGDPYRIVSDEHSAVVLVDLPFTARSGGGVFSRRAENGGTLWLSPSVFPPTRAARDKVVLYREPVR